MVGRLGVATVFVCLAFAFALPPSSGSPLGLDTHVVTRDVPGVGFQYVPADLVADVEGTLTLTNADLAAHDLVSVARGPDTNPWCGRFALGACPLFASELVGLAGQTVVLGLDALQPTDPIAGTPGMYPFTCSVHPWMGGIIVVI